MIIPNVPFDIFCIFAGKKIKNMYDIDQLYDITGGSNRHEIWNGKIACSINGAERTLLTNNMGQSFNGYTFTLILSGELHLVNGSQELGLHRDEMFVYYPGSDVTISAVSDDYQGICLKIATSAAHDSQAFRNLIRATVIPVSQFGKSKLVLNADDASRLRKIMEFIYDYIHQPIAMKSEILEMLTTVFVDDLISIQAFEKARLDISRRTEEIFVSFYSLLQEHFISQHGITFYADRLNITENYLSRVVKKITGKTVVDCIDELLAIEATWLIKSTNLTVAQIADRLNFSTSAALDKFYKRMRSCTPLSLRE